MIPVYFLYLSDSHLYFNYITLLIDTPTATSSLAVVAQAMTSININFVTSIVNSAS